MEFGSVIRQTQIKKCLLQYFLDGASVTNIPGTHFTHSVSPLRTSTRTTVPPVSRSL